MKSSERGVILVFVALTLTVLMALAAFSVDYGVLWVARGQAQNAADAGALAGAIARAYDEPGAPAVGGPTELAAMATAQANVVSGNAPAHHVEPSYVCPPGVAAGRCVQVDVYKDGTGGSGTLPTYFGNVFGVSSQGVKATATAKVFNANAARCLKPWAMADRWADNRPVGGWTSGEGNPGEPGGPASTFDKYIFTGNNFSTLPNPVDNYTAPTQNSVGTGFTTAELGWKLALTVGMQNDRSTNAANDFVANWFMPLDFGNGPYESFITGCNPQTFGIGQTLNIDNQPGNRETGTRDGVNALVAQDPGAHWVNGQGVVGSAFGLSPRIVPIPLVDIDSYIAGVPNGKTTIDIANILAVFIDGWRTADKKVIVHIVPMPGQLIGGGGGVGGGSSFLFTINLVR